MAPIEILVTISSKGGTAYKSFLAEILLPIQIQVIILLPGWDKFMFG